MMSVQMIDDPVVLIGGEGLLVPPFRTEGQPRPVDAVEIVPIEIEFDDPARHGVVQGRDELRDLLLPPTPSASIVSDNCRTSRAHAAILRRCRRIDRMPDLPQTPPPAA
jgi:hypothetical protein